MNELQVFDYEGSRVRTVEIDGEPWFVGKDVATILGYSNPSKAVMVHVDEEDKVFEMMEVSDSQNGNLVKTTVINESGLYSLILSSKLPSAKKFKRWVTSEVLPTLRKTGVFSVSSVKSPSMDDKMVIVEAAARMLNMNDASKILMLERFCDQEGVEKAFLPKYEDNGGRQLIAATTLLKNKVIKASPWRGGEPYERTYSHG